MNERRKKKKVFLNLGRKCDVTREKSEEDSLKKRMNIAHLVKPKDK